MSEPTHLSCIYISTGRLWYKSNSLGVVVKEKLLDDLERQPQIHWRGYINLSENKHSWIGMTHRSYLMQPLLSYSKGSTPKPKEGSSLVNVRSRPPLPTNTKIVSDISWSPTRKSYLVSPSILWVKSCPCQKILPTHKRNDYDENPMVEIKSNFAPLPGLEDNSWVWGFRWRMSLFV